MSLGQSYHHWQTDDGGSGSRAFGYSEHAVSLEEEEEEEASLFPSSRETGGDPTPWRRHREGG